MLVPGLVDEDQAPGLDTSLIGLPARPPAGDVRPALLRRDDGFFEAQPFMMGKLPDRL